MGAESLSSGNNRARTAAANERAQPLSARSPSLRPEQLDVLKSDSLLFLLLPSVSFYCWKRVCAIQAQVCILQMQKMT